MLIDLVLNDLCACFLSNKFREPPPMDKRAEVMLIDLVLNDLCACFLSNKFREPPPMDKRAEVMLIDLVLNDLCACFLSNKFRVFIIDKVGDRSHLLSISLVDKRAEA
ncbi:hypothetical protein J6590_017175 [Homalodisca vitripennis]|nr:hypothetical protein J6590_017175 [Homalodisca vitripennis]